MPLSVTKMKTRAFLAASLCLPLGAFALAAAQPTQATDPNAVVARFAGGQITVGDMEQALAPKSPWTRAQHATADGKKAFLERMLTYDLLVLEAQRRGYATNPQVVREARAAAVRALVTELTAITPEQIEAEAVAAYYEAHKSRYVQGEQRRATHVVFKTKEAAKQLLGQAKGLSRMELAKLARERSEDARARATAGELGYFNAQGRRSAEGKVEIDAALVRAAFAIGKTGQLAAAPVKHAGGYSVLMLTAIKPATRRTLAQVEGAIRAALVQQRGEKATDDLVAQLRQGTQVEVHPETLDAMKLERSQEPGIPPGVASAPLDPRAPPQLVPPEDD